MLRETEIVRPRASHYGPDREQSVAFHQMAAGVPVRGCIRRIRRYVAEVILVEPSAGALRWEMGLKDLKHVRPPELWDGDKLTEFWQKRFNEKLEKLTAEWLVLQQYRGELKSLFQEIFACFQVDKQLFEQKAAYYREQNAILHKRRSEKLISREEFLEQSGHLLQKLPVIPQHQLVRELENAVRFLTGTDCSWESIGALLDSLQ